ncbi:MAG: SAM hydroxide adenosyltransferase, partial [Cyanobacteria bacterium J06621_11]
ANGVPIRELGDRIEPGTLIQPDLSACVPNPDWPTSVTPIICTGSLQYIDGFGNLISNIPGQFVPSNPDLIPWQIQIETDTESHQFLGVRTYSDVPVGTLAALVGSHGWVEVACNGGSAQTALQSLDKKSAVMVGNTVSLKTASP